MNQLSVTYYLLHLPMPKTRNDVEILMDLISNRRFFADFGL